MTPSTSSRPLGTNDLIGNPPRASARGVSIAFAGLLLSFVFVLVLFGGASRYDEIAQVPVRLMALLVVLVAIFRRPIESPRELKGPAILLGCAIGLVSLHLIPLPPGIWTALPGRAAFAEAADAAGWPQPWRPLALSPDLALNALLSLTVPVAMLFALTRASRQQSEWIVPTLLAVLVVSMIAVSIQLVSSSDGFSWIYRVLFEGWSPGIFTNRNHQALLLAIGFPLLAGWRALRSRGRSGSAARIAAPAFVLLLILVLLGSGSRAGLVLGLLGVLGSGAVYWSARDLRQSSRNRKAVLWVVAAVTAVVGLLFLAATLGRAIAIDRLLQIDLNEDMRVQTFSTTSGLVTEYFPAGTGFGSFDPAFRHVEPDALLDASYMNQAHNDLLQVVLEGGLPGLVLLVVAISWLILATVRLWRHRGSATVLVQARAASVSLVLIALASAVDYPLRTPTLMAITAALTFLVALGLGEINRAPGPPSRES